jgi:uracil-DNA glycosylase
MRAIYQAGIEKVIVKSKYTDFKSLKEMKDLTICESITAEGYIELTYKPRLPRVVFVGANPSSKSPDDSAFHPDTKSGKRVQGWIEGLNIDAVFLNLHEHKTTMNKSLSKKQIEDGFFRLSPQIRDLDPDLLVTVGEEAKSAFSMYQCKRHHMPHPSGLSRFWNNKQDAAEAINALRQIISEV